MIKFHFKNIIRHLIKNKVYSLINIASLVIGFTCFILIAFWIKYEISFDDFHPNANRTFRIAYDGVIHGSEVKDATTAKVFTEVLNNDFPEVETATILTHFGEALLSKDDGTAFMVKLSGINPDFFDVFNAPVIKGDINDLLKPNTAFITHETAVKFFGKENPIGKAISTGMDRENKRFTIVGILEEFPENSHLDFDMLYSNISQSWYNNAENDWLNANFHNYVVLKPNTDIKAFEEKFNALALEKIAPIVQRWQNITIEEWFDKGDKVRFVFHPLRKLHHTPSYDNEYKQTGSMVYIYIFIIVGTLILLISIINFSNLSTVKSLSRSKEIGVRKTFGSNRRSLIIQFLFESCFLSIIALAISLFLVTLISPYFRDFSGIEIWTEKNIKWWIFLSLVIIAVFSGLTAGAFPAFYISKQSPVAALSSFMRKKFKGVFFKDILIVVQFAISILVIIGAFVITKQLNYLQNENLGFIKDNKLVIKGVDNISWENVLLLNKELCKINDVKSSSSSHFIPKDDCRDRNFSFTGDKEVKDIKIDVLPCDHNFQNVYQFELAKGKFFDESFSNESRKIVLNEKAALLLNTDNFIGKILNRRNVKYEIIGVVKDFHYCSKHEEIKPLAMVQLPDAQMFWNPYFCSVLIRGNNIQKTVEDIKEVWSKISPGTEFSYSFFDDDYNMIYKQEMLTKKLFVLFSFIAICLSCFGLFSFVKYLLRARTKEIGIRKVNGASIFSIFLKLSKYFTRPIGIAMIIAFPIAYYLINNWLNTFEYKIDIEISYFLLSGLLTLVSVFITVGFLTYRAARRNPVEALRYE